MSRWQPNTPDRLQRAALDAYSESGFERTTVAEIAQRAGLTERTYFRHFADKREVLFWGSDLLTDVIVGAVGRTPDTATPNDAVAAGLDAAAMDIFQAERWDFARQRQAVIAANGALQERELAKLAALAAAIAGALRGRGVAEPAATLAAEAGVVVFRVAFDRWVGDDRPGDFSVLLRETLAALSQVVAGTGTTSSDAWIPLTSASR